MIANNLDPKYHDPLVTKFINKVMRDGKKETARTVVYAALEKLAGERQSEPAAILQEVINKAAPILEVRSRRVGGANYQVPVEVKPTRKVMLVYRWILKAVRASHGSTASERLYTEMKNILDGTGSVIKTRDDLHKMAESNRAFAHFARY